MEDHQTYEGTSNGSGPSSGYGHGDGFRDRRGSGNGDGYGDGCGCGFGWTNLDLQLPIPFKYHYLLENQTIIQRVKIHYDLHNASTQEDFDLLVEWYEAVQEIDKAR